MSKFKRDIRYIGKGIIRDLFGAADAGAFYLAYRWGMMASGAAGYAAVGYFLLAVGMLIAAVFLLWWVGGGARPIKIVSKEASK